MLLALDQGLVDIALVELGIAHQRDEAATLVVRERAAGGEPVLDQAGEQGDGDPEADRAGGEVDRDPVLGPAGIALRAAEAAEILQRGAVLAPSR